VESGIHGIKKQKNHGFRSAPTHGFSRCPVRFSLLRPTGRLTEKEASPKRKTAKTKEPVDHLILISNLLFNIAVNQYRVRIILSIQKKSTPRQAHDNDHGELIENY
jgi:hypothetical protein